jgi:hypothetical protein
MHCPRLQRVHAPTQGTPWNVLVLLPVSRVQANCRRREEGTRAEGTTSGSTARSVRSATSAGVQLVSAAAALPRRRPARSRSRPQVPLGPCQRRAAPHQRRVGHAPVLGQVVLSSSPRSCWAMFLRNVLFRRPQWWKEAVDSTRRGPSWLAKGSSRLAGSLLRLSRFGEAPACGQYRPRNLVEVVRD